MIFMGRSSDVSPKARGNFILLVLTLLPGALQAQVDTAWVRRYNGPGNRADYFNDLAVDPSGNACVTGASWVSGNGLDFITIRYTPSGDTAWVRTFNGAGDSTDVACRVDLDRGGNVFVAGAGIGNNSKQDYLVLKYDSLGTLLWSRTYNGPSSEADVPNALALDSVGDAFVTGRSHGGSTGYDYLTIAYKPNGDTAWVRRYSGTPSGYDEAFGVGMDRQTCVVVTGRSYMDSTRADYLTLKYSPTGDTLWSRRYDGNQGDDIASDLILDAEGNVCVTGKSLGAAGNDVLTLKYAPDGTLRWARRYDGPAGGEDEGTGMTLDRFGNIAVCGSAATSGGTTDALILKYDSLGTLCWARTYDGPTGGNDVARAVASDSQGNLYLTGRSVGVGTQEDFFTACYDSGGTRRWVQHYDGQGGYDEALGIGLDRQGDVLVTGQSWGGASSWDGATIKYRPVTGVAEISEASQPPRMAFSLRGPCKERISFRYLLPAAQWVHADLFDGTGRRVANLLSGYRSAGEHREQAILDVSSGVYFLRLTAGGEERFGKTVVLR
jgi:hypothetical protein